MRQLKRLISRIAPSPSSVMVVGESGTGKEVVARAIHKLSGRRNKPFIAINCAAIRNNFWRANCSVMLKAHLLALLPTVKQG